MWVSLSSLPCPLKASAPETTVRTFMTQRRSQCARSTYVHMCVHWREIIYVNGLPYVCVYFTYALKVYEHTICHMMCPRTYLQYVCMYDALGGTYLHRFVRGACDKMDGSCLLSHKVEKSKVCCLVSPLLYISGAGAVYLWIHRPPSIRGLCRCLFVPSTCEVCVAARDVHICMSMLGGTQTSAVTS